MFRIVMSGVIHIVRYFYEEMRFECVGLGLDVYMFSVGSFIPDK